MTIGIYCIRNTVDDKRYIGKSRNIEARLYTHRNTLSKSQTKDVNRHLYAAVQKYGIDAFEFFILEEHTELDEARLSDRELFFIDLYNTCCRDHGYNLRRDSSTNTFVHDETRKLISLLNTGFNNPNYGNRWTDEMKESMSKIAKERHAAGVYGDEWKQKIGKASTEMWKDVDKKHKMAKKVSETRSKFRFFQFDKHTKELIRVWESMDEIIKENPDYFRIAIYNVCRGDKKSYRGYVWIKELKSPEKEGNDLYRHRNQLEAQQDLAMCDDEGWSDQALEKS